MENAVIVQQKKWWWSKVVWFNVITTAYLLGEAASKLPLTPRQSAGVGVVVAVANIVLRVWFTGAPVTNAGAKAAETGPPN